MSSEGKASVRQLELPLDAPGDEAITGTRGEDAPVEEGGLLERVLEAGHLRRALHQVRRHQGAPGIDGMTVDDLGAYLKTHWPTIRAALLEGTYAPQPVRRTEIPKPGGGIRKLGIPTVLDRFIEQALLQILQEEWDPTFSERSDGFRPQRSAHQAVGQAQASIRDGDTWVGDLEQCCDRVHHEVWLRRGRRRVQDRRVLTLIHRCLNAGVLPLEGRVEPTAEGTPHGGPRSPLRAHRLRDERDTELEQRGHRFARDADEANSDGRSRQAGARVMARVARVLERTRRRKGHETTSAVDRPWNRTCRGCTCPRRQPNRRQVREKALKAVTAKVRALTGRTRGRTLGQIVTELRQRLRGWRACFGFAAVRSPLRDLDTWIRRRLRSDPWKPWGRKRYRELRTRGVGRQLAWNTVTSAHGPWRLSQSPALSIALPQRSFAALGLPSLTED